MTNEESNSSVFRPALLITAGQIVGFMATFAMPIVLVRIFTQAEFGTYKQLFLIFATLLSIAQIGTSGSLYYFIPKADRGGAPYVANTLILMVASGTVCLILLWWNAGRIASWLNNPDLAQYIPYIGLYLCIMLLATMLENVMISRKRHAIASATYALSSIFRAVLLIVPAVIFQSLELLLIGAIGFAVLRLLATFFYLAREYPGRQSLDHSLWKPHLAYTIPFGVSTWINVIERNINQYAVSSYFNPASFAIYSVGARGIPLVGFLTDSTGNVMMVKMREYTRAGRNEKVSELWRDITRKLLLIFAPISGVLIVSSHALIITLFTDQYVESIPIFEIASVGMIGAAFMTHGIMRVYAQNRFLIVLNSMKIGVVLLAVTLLMPWLGLSGAVIAALITTVFSRTMELWRSKIVMECSLKQLLPWKSLAITLIIAGVAALPALAARLYTNLPLIAELFLIPTLYLGTYAALIWRYGPVSPEEKTRIIRTLQRFASRYLMPLGRSTREPR